MSMTDKLSHLNSLNARLGSYEERLQTIVAAIGGHYPVNYPEGGQGGNLTKTASAADNDSLLETFEGSNRFAVFVLDRIEQHLAHLQQYVHGEPRDAAVGKSADIRRFDTENAFAEQVPDSITIGGFTYHRS